MTKFMFSLKDTSLPTHRVEGRDLVFSHRIDIGKETYSTLLTEKTDLFELRVVIIASMRLVKIALYYQDMPVVGNDVYIKYSKIKYLFVRHYLFTLPKVIEAINKTYLDYKGINLDTVKAVCSAAKVSQNCQELFDSYEKNNYHFYGFQNSLQLTAFNHKLVKFNFTQDYYLKDDFSLERKRHLFYCLDGNVFYRKINVFYYTRKKLAILDKGEFNNIIKSTFHPMANRFGLSCEYEQFWYFLDGVSHDNYLLGIINIETQHEGVSKGRINMYTGVKIVLRKMPEDKRYLNLYYLLDRQEKKLTINYLFSEDKEKPITQDYSSEIIEYANEDELAVSFSYFMLSKAYQHVKIRDEVKAILGETDKITHHHFDLLEMVDL